MRQIWEKLLSFAISDLGLKLFSLFFAAGLWFFVNAGQKAMERSFQVPVELRNIPSNLIIANPGLSQIEVRAMGPPALLSTVTPDYLKVVLDLEGARPGTSTFRLGPDFFNPPRGVRVTRISPSEIHLKLELVAARSLPVKVRFAGKLPSGYKIASVEVTPQSVKVRGPAEEVNRMLVVETEPVELVEGGREQVIREVRLASSDKLLSFSPDRVSVSVLLEEEWITREFTRVEVSAKDFSGRYTVSPRGVYLRLSGPKRILDPLPVGREQVYLDLKGLGPGTHVLPLNLKLPPEIKVLEQKPARFRVTISRTEEKRLED